MSATLIPIQYWCMTVSGLLKNKSYRLLAGILLLTLLVNIRIPGNDLAVDDYPAIFDNDLVQKGVSGIPAIFSHSYYYGYDQRQEANEYRPVASSFYAIQRALFGKKEAAPYHWMSLLLYLLLLVLLFEWIKKLADERTALIATLIFALMPVHTEVVANIKAQDDLLMGVFFLFSCLFWLQEKTPLKRGFALVFYLLALFCKEGALPLILVFPAMDYLRNRKLEKGQLLLLIPAALYLVCRLAVLDPVENIDVVNNAFAYYQNGWERLAMSFELFLRYLGKLIWPWPLSWDYSFRHFDWHGWLNWKSIIGLAVFVSLVVWVVKNIKKPGLSGFAAFFFLLSITLYLQVIFLLEATFAERFLFIPSIAFALVLALVWQKHAAVKWTLVLGLALWAGIVWQRNGEWKNSLTLFEADLEKVPNSMRANSALAYALYEKAIAMQEPDARLLERSAELYRTAVNLYGKDATTWYNYGLCVLAQGDYTMAEICFAESLRLNPKNSLAHNNLGNIKYLKGEHEQAKEYYRRASELDPLNSEAWSNLGAEYLLFKQNDSAAFALEKALKLDPGNEDIRYNYDVVQKRLGRVTSSGQ